MNKPEWSKALDEHNQGEKHRTIFVSTANPTATDGVDGDIWIVYEE